MLLFLVWSRSAFSRMCFILVSHVLFGRYLKYLIFSYLSLFIPWFPYPTFLYRCVSHLLPEMYSHIICMFSPPIYLRFLCIVYVLSMYSFTNFALFKRFNIMNINLNFNRLVACEQAAHRLSWGTIWGTG